MSCRDEITIEGVKEEDNRILKLCGVRKTVEGFSVGPLPLRHTYILHCGLFHPISSSLMRVYQIL